jgi:hypothetical protein
MPSLPLPPAGTKPVPAIILIGSRAARPGAGAIAAAPALQRPQRNVRPAFHVAGCRLTNLYAEFFVIAAAEMAPYETGHHAADDRHVPHGAA